MSMLSLLGHLPSAGQMDSNFSLSIDLSFSKKFFSVLHVSCSLLHSPWISFPIRASTRPTYTLLPYDQIMSSVRSASHHCTKAFVQKRIWSTWFSLEDRCNQFKWNVPTQSFGLLLLLEILVPHIKNEKERCSTNCTLWEQLWVACLNLSMI